MAEHLEKVLVARFFDDKLDRKRWIRLHRHMRECESCRTAYEEARLPLKRAEGLADDTQDLTGREMELASNIVARRLEERRAGIRAARGVAAGLAALSVAAGVVLSIRNPQDELHAKGTMSASVGASISCFSPTDLDHPQTLDTRSGHCAAGSLLKIQARSLDERFRVFAAVADSSSSTGSKVLHTQLEGTGVTRLDGYYKLAMEPFVLAFVFSERELTEAELTEFLPRQGASPEARDGYREIKLTDGRIAMSKLVNVQVTANAYVDGGAH